MNKQNTYTFKKSFLKPIEHWEINDNCLLIKRVGQQDIKIQLYEISQLRFSCASAWFYCSNYSATLCTRQGKFSYYAASVELSRKTYNQNESYSLFSKALTNKLRLENPVAQIMVGIPKRRYFLRILFLATFLSYLAYLVFADMQSLSEIFQLKVLALLSLSYILFRLTLINRPISVEGELPRQSLPLYPTKKPQIIKPE